MAHVWLLVHAASIESIAESASLAPGCAAKVGLEVLLAVGVVVGRTEPGQRACTVTSVKANTILGIVTVARRFESVQQASTARTAAKATISSKCAARTGAPVLQSIHSMVDSSIPAIAAAPSTGEASVTTTSTILRLLLILFLCNDLVAEFIDIPPIQSTGGRLSHAIAPQLLLLGLDLGLLQLDLALGVGEDTVVARRRRLFGV